MKNITLLNTNWFVHSANIDFFNNVWILNVKTTSGYKDDWFKTLRGAKIGFTRNFFKGAIWKEV